MTSLDEEKLNKLSRISRKIIDFNEGKKLRLYVHFGLHCSYHQASRKHLHGFLDTISLGFTFSATRTLLTGCFISKVQSLDHDELKHFRLCSYQMNEYLITLRLPSITPKIKAVVPVLIDWLSYLISVINCSNNEKQWN